MDKNLEFDVEARHRAVVGDRPRIEPLEADAMDQGARNLVRDIRRSAGVEDTDDLPEFMRTMIKHPALFKCQAEMGSLLYNGLIPTDERELAILRNAWLIRAPFEWAQHVNIARRLGMPNDIAERAKLGSAAEGWSRHERAILKGVEELFEDAALSQETWDILAETWNEAQMIEFCQLIGQYVATAYVQNSIRARLEGCEDGLAAL